MVPWYSRDQHQPVGTHYANFPAYYAILKCYFYAFATAYKKLLTVTIEPVKLLV